MRTILSEIMKKKLKAKLTDPDEDVAFVTKGKSPPQPIPATNVKYPPQPIPETNVKYPPMPTPTSNLQKPVQKPQAKATPKPTKKPEQEKKTYSGYRDERTAGRSASGKEEDKKKKKSRTIFSERRGNNLYNE